MAVCPAAGAPRPLFPSLRPALPPQLPCPIMSVPGGPCRPCPCPWVPSRPPYLRCLSTPWVPPTVTCALARTASARILTVPVPMPLAAPTFANRAPLNSMPSLAACLGAQLAPRPSRALALSLLRAPLRAVRCPCSVPLRWRWLWRPAHAFALAPCRVRPGLSSALVLEHSPCRIPFPAPRSRDRHSAPPARCPPPPRSRAGRPVAAVAAAA